MCSCIRVKLKTKRKFLCHMRHWGCNNFSYERAGLDGFDGVEAGSVDKMLRSHNLTLVEK